MMHVSRHSRPFLHLPRTVIVPLLIATISTLWCWWVVDGGLGLLLGAMILVALEVPGLADVTGAWPAAPEPADGRRLSPPGDSTPHDPSALDPGNNRDVASTFGAGLLKPLVITLAVTLGTTIVWRLVSSTGDLSGVEWLSCTLVLFAWTWALAGVSVLLASARLSHATAASITTTVALLWLTWPVWLSHWMTEDLARWLSAADPLFAINSVVKHLGTWDRAPLAYRALTVLNQDVSYRLPRTIWPAVLLHLLIGAPGTLTAARSFHHGRGPLRRRSPAN